MMRRKHRSFWQPLFLLAACAVLLSACAPRSPRVVGHTAPAVEIVQIPLRWSNAFLLKGKRSILVDTGSPGDGPTLKKALADHGLRPEDLALVVLTHAHADHAGGWTEIRPDKPPPVALAEGDRHLAEDGSSGDAEPDGLLVRLIGSLVPSSYPGFRPDIVIRDQLNLHSYGMEGVVRPLPGHTHGSVVIWLSGGQVVAGDLILGGLLGGAILPERPGEHYFHEDRETNRCNIEALIRAGAQRFYLGHGGPVERKAVIEAFGLDVR